MKMKGLSGIVNLLGVAFLAIALLLALTSPTTVGAAPAAQATATTAATAAATATTAATVAATATTAATPAATATAATPSTLPTTGAADKSLALGIMTLAGLGFLGLGLALRALAPKSTR